MSPEKMESPDVATVNYKSSRRDLLKRALIVLGASVILQPNGGVLGAALGGEPKKEKRENKGEGANKEKHRKHHGGQRAKENRGTGRRHAAGSGATSRLFAAL
jgi:hypothetical protein